MADGLRIKKVSLFGGNGEPLEADQQQDEADELADQQQEDVDGAAAMPPEVAASNVTDIIQYAAQR
jgi:hypothetical protein